MLAVIMLALLVFRAVAFRSARESVIVNETVFKTMADEVAEKSVADVELFRFDPNSVSFDSLRKLGLTERQATTFINYRKSGGRFRNAKDISRVYGLDSVLVSKLVPLITFSAAKKNVSSGNEYVTRSPVSSAIQHVTPLTPVCYDLNRCSAADLEQLPGIGAVLSERIIKYRNLLGGFVSTGQLKEVYGLDSATIEKIQFRVEASGDSVVKILLDSCTFAQMAKHPYFGPEMARAIMKYRTLMGLPVKVDDLVAQHVITASQAELIAPYTVTPGTVDGR